MNGWQNHWLRLVLITLFCAGLSVVVQASVSGRTQSTANETEPGAPDFREFPAGDARKEAFFSFMTPLVESANASILKNRHQLEQLHPARRSDKGLFARQWHDLQSWWQQEYIELLAASYGLVPFDIEDPAQWDLLLRRVDVVPASLVLAQAANESAWGTSRFARQGNNYFGQWCFETGCGLVPRSRAKGRTYEVRSFDNARASVESYLNNINTHRAYLEFRQLRAKKRAEGEAISGLELATTLSRYSQRGKAYVREIRSMIQQNNLQSMDPES